jgi:hypothetical protein
MQMAKIPKNLMHIFKVSITANLRENQPRSMRSWLYRMLKKMTKFNFPQIFEHFQKGMSTSSMCS